jgi:hypothetical protein
MAGNRRVLLFLLPAALCVILIAAFLIGRGRGGGPGVAVVTVKGAEALSLELSSEPNRIISLEQSFGVPVSLEISGGAIRYINVTCPDHTCEKTGFISRPGETAVCMPNRVVVTIA